MATQGHSHVSSRKGRFCALELWSPWRERYVLASFSGNSGWPPIWTMHTQETMQQRPHRTRDLQRHVHIPHASIVSVWTFIPNVDITCPETTTVTVTPSQGRKTQTRETPRVFNPEEFCHMRNGPYKDVSPLQISTKMEGHDLWWERFSMSKKLLVGAIFHAFSPHENW